jgi:hypothetical protein
LNAQSLKHERYLLAMVPNSSLADVPELDPAAI